MPNRGPYHHQDAALDTLDATLDNRDTPLHVWIHTDNDGVNLTRDEALAFSYAIQRLAHHIPQEQP